MNTLKSVSGLFGLMLLVGCVSATSNPATPPVTSAAIAAAETPRAGLPAQTLEAGECGLFLWTRRQQPEFIFFSKVGTERGEFWDGEKAIALSRTGFGGDIFGQELTEQTFVTGDGRTAKLSLVPGDQLVSGQRVPEASITIIDAEGWSTLIPAAGVSVCQPTP